MVKRLKAENKKKNLKKAREKWLIMHEGSPGRLKSDFSRETRGQKAAR